MHVLTSHQTPNYRVIDGWLTKCMGALRAPVSVVLVLYIPSWCTLCFFWENQKMSHFLFCVALNHIPNFPSKLCMPVSALDNDIFYQAFGNLFLWCILCKTTCSLCEVIYGDWVSHIVTTFFILKTELLRLVLSDFYCWRVSCVMFNFFHT